MNAAELLQHVALEYGRIMLGRGPVEPLVAEAIANLRALDLEPGAAEEALALLDKLAARSPCPSPNCPYSRQATAFDLAAIIRTAYRLRRATH